MSTEAMINQRLELEARNMKALRETLDKSGQLTSGICSILSSFEDRLGRLEETILPVYNDTAKLQKRQHNVEQILLALDDVIGYYNVSKEVEGIIRDDPATRGLDVYLQALDKVYQALVYFQANNPQSVELENVTTLLEVGTDVLYKEFRDKLTQHSKPCQLLDFIGLDEEDKRPSSLVEFPDGVKQNLIQISSWLSDHKKDSHFTVFAKIRSSIMLRSLQGLKDEHSTDTATPSPPIALQGRSKFSNKMEQTATQAKRVQKLLEKKAKKFYSRVSVAAGAGMPRTGSNIEFGGEDLVSINYMAHCSGLLHLMQAELELMKDVIPLRHHSKVYEIIIRDSMDMIVKDGESLAASTSRSVREMDFRVAETLCPVLRHMSGLNQEFEAILCGFTINTLSRLQSLLKLLINTEDDALNTLVECIRNESERLLPKDGTVHELTSNVLNYLGRLLPYEDVLANVLQRNALYKSYVDRHPNKDSKKLVVGAYVGKVLAALGLNLSSKSEAYGDLSLKALFRINNYSYMLSFLYRTGMLQILEEFQPNAENDYNQQIEDHKNIYMQSWTRAIGYLEGNDVPAYVLHSNKLKDRDRQIIKDKFMGFNREIQEIHRIQKGYSVPDAELREGLKRDNKEYILPKYQQFYDKYADVDFTRNREKYVKYSPSDISQLIESFFDIAA